MTATDAGIAARLEEYRAARGLDRGSLEYRQLLSGYRHNPHFAELLEKELARLHGAANARNDKRGSPQ